MKKFYLIFLCFILFCPFFVNASDGIVARIGNNFYDTLEDAINAAGPNDIITITSDIDLNNTIDINKTINIDLNNHTITGKNRVFEVFGGSLNLTGTGKIKESEPYYGAIVVMGSDNPNDVDFSTVSVSKNVTLEGWSGVFLDHNGSSSYGVNINFNGTINAVNDTDGGTGAGIYANGNIKNTNNYPTITLGDTTKITSTGNGLYIAGYTKVNINGAYINGDESGIAAKAGIININDGTILCEGEDKTPTEGYNNGVKPSGTAIQIESNTGYAGNIKLNIKDGTIKSKNSNTIYEYVVGSSPTQVDSISLSGGTYISGNSKNVFNFSDSFKNMHKGFITGGSFSSDPSSYIASGYDVANDGNMYKVAISTMGNNLLSVNNNGNNIFKIITIIIGFLLLIFIYLKKDMIINFIRR